MHKYEKGQVAKMAAEVRTLLEKSSNISVSVLNYGLQLEKPVITALEKALKPHGIVINKAELKYSFMGYVKFEKTEDRLGEEAEAHAFQQEREGAEISAQAEREAEERHAGND